MIGGAWCAASERPLAPLAGFQLQQVAHGLSRHAILELDHFDVELAGLRDLAHSRFIGLASRGSGFFFHEGAEAVLTLDQAGGIESAKARRMVTRET